VEEGNIRPAQLLGVGADALFHAALAEIEALDHVKTEPVQLAAMSQA
jgi:hypothetical protein